MIQILIIITNKNCINILQLYILIKTIINKIKKMGKQQQQQNLYQLLLQRNQVNYQVIRKFRKKYINHHSKICLFYPKDYQDCQISASAGKEKGDMDNKNRDMEIAIQGDHYKQDQKQKDNYATKQNKPIKNEKQGHQKTRQQRIQSAIFPSIGYFKYPNNKNKSDKNSSSMNSKINIIMSVSSTLGNLREYQKLKTLNSMTQHIKNSQQKCINPLISIQNIKNHNNNAYPNQNTIQSCQHGAHNQNFNNKNYNGDNNLHQQLKAQVMIIQNVNKQEKVNNKANCIENKDISDIKDNKIKDTHINVSMQKQRTQKKQKQHIDNPSQKIDKQWSHNKHHRSKIKCKKYQEYYKELCSRSNIKDNQNISQTRKHKWLTNITNLINNNSLDNGSVFSSCKNINIGFLHTITYANKANYQIGNKSIIGNTSNNKVSICKRTSKNKNHSKILQQSSNIVSGISTSATTTKNSTKFPQMLPQIRKFKQFKYNFQKLIKKEGLDSYHNNSITLNASNCSQTHNQANNYSCVGSAILKNSPLIQNGNNNENYNCSTVLCTKGASGKTGSGGTACTLFDSLSECSNRLFKMQSIPGNYMKRV